MTFCDAHLHLVQCGHVPDFADYAACTCAHDTAEFAAQESLIARALAHAAESGLKAPRIVSAFGIHPQAPLTENIPFLEELLRSGRIQAVGEAGFDFFTPEFASQEQAQEEVWHAQLELAATYGVPLVNHTRKALDRLFRDSKLLSRLPAVIFHSFMGSEQDALSLLRHGVNGFFSFGKPIINGKKSAISCVRALPADRLLLETDAPYQTLKGESKTAPEEIVRVYQAAAEIRGTSIRELSAQLKTTFYTAFCIN
ncbi:MAG: TatD family hydrolase [Treponema sp.]|nr:TatD family hydrolase [Treponema sp.]